jgi:hypothetical protein
VLIVRALFDVFGMKTYLPYALVVILIHLGIAWMVFALSRRAGCPPWPAAAAAFLVAFISIGPENILWDATMNNTGAILLGYIACYVLLVTDVNARGTVMAWVLLIAALSFSGTGISAVVMAAVLAATQRSPLAGARVMSLPTAAFLLWYVGYGRDDSTYAISETTDYFQVPLFVWTGLTKALGNSVGVVEAGPVVFVILVASLLTDRRASAALRHVAWAGFAAATAQLTLEGLSRISLGVDIAATGRYAYFTFVLLAPAMAMALARAADVTLEPRWFAAVAASVLAISYALHGVGTVRTYADGYGGVSREWRDRLLGMVASADDKQQVLTATYDDPVNTMLSQDLVAEPEVRAALPDVSPDPRQRLNAEMMFNVGVGQEGYGLFNPAFLDMTFGWNRPSVNGPGCHAYRATVENPMLQLATDDGMEIGVTSQATEVVTVLQRGDHESDSRIWQVDPGSLYIASSAKDAVLKVSFNRGGEFVICKQ